MSVAQPVDKMAGMFTVDEPTAEAIRRAYADGGELAGVVELRRHYPLLADNAHAGLCVRAIAGWKPVPPKENGGPRRG
jgi:hypothetical protein